MLYQLKLLNWIKNENDKKWTMKCFDFSLYILILSMLYRISQKRRLMLKKNRVKTRKVVQRIREKTLIKVVVIIHRIQWRCLKGRLREKMENWITIALMTLFENITCLQIFQRILSKINICASFQVERFRLARIYTLKCLSLMVYYLDGSSYRRRY